MPDFLDRLGEALMMSAGMLWHVGWSLVLGLLISAALQAFVSKDRIAALLGRDGAREIALATGFGAASSSCSYAAVSIARTLISKGSGFAAALAFMFASTNLVAELGVVLYLLMGWQFMVAEWVGGIVLVVIMSIIVKLTCPAALLEDARRRAAGNNAAHGHEHGHAHQHHDAPHHAPAPQNRDARMAIARHFMMDWSMLGRDIIIGFAVAGILAVFVPAGFWQGLFAAHTPDATRAPLDALIGPLVAAASFVCSVGNVPLAAILWAGGASFGGVLAFLYGDLIALPLLDVYRRAFGWKMAAYIGVVFYITMAVTGYIMHVAFETLHLVPAVKPAAMLRADMASFSVDYTFWLNLVFGIVGLYFAWLSKRQPAAAVPSCCGHHK
ncbi:MAG: permease [Alphaproteobacteria bacterium]|nr:permease [Alphaproteobacteria bacterium]